MQLMSCTKKHSEMQGDNIMPSSAMKGLPAGTWTPKGSLSRINNLYMEDPSKFYTQDGRESKPARPNFTVGAPLASKIALGLSLNNDSMVCCDFVWPLIGNGTVGSLHAFHLKKTQAALELMADPSRSSFQNFTARLFTAVTGIEKSKEEFLFDAWHALTIERAVHVRDNDRLPEDDQPNGITMDRPDAYRITIDCEEWRKGFGMLYELMGWDPETGRATEKGLQYYGLDNVAVELEKIGRTSHTDINLNLQKEMKTEGQREYEKNHEYYINAWPHMLNTKGQFEIKAHYYKQAFLVLSMAAGVTSIPAAIPLL